MQPCLRQVCVRSAAALPDIFIRSQTDEMTDMNCPGLLDQVCDLCDPQRRFRSLRIWTRPSLFLNEYCHVLASGNATRAPSARHRQVCRERLSARGRRVAEESALALVSDRKQEDLS